MITLKKAKKKKKKSCSLFPNQSDKIKKKLLKIIKDQKPKKHIRSVVELSNL